MFSNRTIAIATMHQKELVIAPLLKESFGMDCIIPPEINTDALGTFSGEIERIHHPLDVAREKCRIAMELSGCDIAVASEGSFGPHPSLFFAASDDEIVVLVDRKNNLEIVGRKLSTETNFRGAEIKSLTEAISFAEEVGFPKHGLIIRESKESIKEICKGIIDAHQLDFIVKTKLNHSDSLWVETDMRAMHNPTRLKVIEQATENLISKMQSKCPSCAFPGFWITDVKAGLPCSLCRSATKSTLAHVYACQKCNYSEERKYPNSLTVEDPMYCDFCNP